MVLLMHYINEEIKREFVGCIIVARGGLDIDLGGFLQKKRMIVERGLNMTHNLGQIAQVCGALLPISILLIRNEDDRNLIIQVYTDYRFLMYRIARHYFGSNEADIEDAISSTLKNLCQHVEKIRPENCNNLKAYVLSIIGNVCRRMIMKKNRDDALCDYSCSEDDIEKITDANDPFQTVFDHSDAMLLLESFDALSSKERILIQMRHIDKMEYREIALELGTTEQAARVALHRAKRHLQTVNLDTEGAESIFRNCLVYFNCPLNQ